jgi:hypothetical protein
MVRLTATFTSLRSQNIEILSFAFWSSCTFGSQLGNFMGCLPTPRHQDMCSLWVHGIKTLKLSPSHLHKTSENKEMTAFSRYWIACTDISGFAWRGAGRHRWRSKHFKHQRFKRSKTDLRSLVFPRRASLPSFPGFFSTCLDNKLQRLPERKRQKEPSRQDKRQTNASSLCSKYTNQYGTWATVHCVHDQEQQQQQQQRQYN